VPTARNRAAMLRHYDGRSGSDDIPAGHNVPLCFEVTFYPLAMMSDHDALLPLVAGARLVSQPPTPGAEPRPGRRRHLFDAPSMII
jgi:hypothetical protein